MYYSQRTKRNMLKIIQLLDFCPVLSKIINNVIINNFINNKYEFENRFIYLLFLVLKLFVFHFRPVVEIKTFNLRYKQIFVDLLTALDMSPPSLPFMSVFLYFTTLISKL